MEVPSNKRHLSLETNPMQLLPGILDEITLNQITPRLAWRDILTLDSVSRGWFHAIRSRQVHNARVSSHSAEKLILHSHIPAEGAFDEDIAVVTVISVRDHSVIELPPLPNLRRGILRESKCLTLAGKVYVLMEKQTNRHHDCDGKVYSMDLAAGERVWKDCCRMEQPRSKFTCAAMDGKIYVFGGLYDSSSVSGSEVYNPEENAWSRIKPIDHNRCNYSAATVGDELVLYAGVKFDLSDFPILRPQLVTEENTNNPPREASNLLIYHPGKDEWRAVTPIKDPGFMRTVFPARGKFYSLGMDSVAVFDFEKTSWRKLHSCTFAALGPVESISPLFVLALENESFASVCWVNRESEDLNLELVRCEGFGSETTEVLAWERMVHLPLDGFPPCHEVSCMLLLEI